MKKFFSCLFVGLIACVGAFSLSGCDDDDPNVSAELVGVDRMIGEIKGHLSSGIPNVADIVVSGEVRLKEQYFDLDGYLLYVSNIQYEPDMKDRDYCFDLTNLIGYKASSNGFVFYFH